METVTVSPKYQVVIPRAVREALGVKPGQRLQVLCHSDRIELLPVKPLAELRGLLKGLDTHVEREADRV